MFWIFSIKIWKTCHCCCENSMFCQLLFSFDIFELNAKINSIFFVFREIIFNEIMMLFRRRKENDDDVIWNFSFNWSKKCSKNLNRKIFAIDEFKFEMIDVKSTLIQSRNCWLFRKFSMTITKFLKFLRKRMRSTIHFVE